MKIMVFNNLCRSSIIFSDCFKKKKPHTAAEFSTQLENITSPVTSVCPISINGHQFHNFSRENLYTWALGKQHTV